MRAFTIDPADRPTARANAATRVSGAVSDRGAAWGRSRGFARPEGPA